MLKRCTDQIVLPADGRFYPAKDSVLSREAAWQSFTPSAVQRFLEIKEELDPGSMLQSDLFRRLFTL